MAELPKWCGIKTTVEQLANNILYMDDPEKKEAAFRGALRMIDEWQFAPKL